jgi:WD40 repeat protein
VNDRLDLALLLAVRANRMRDTTDTRASLLADLSATPYLGHFLIGHTDWVRSVAFSHDPALTGTLMASAGLDRDIILWDSFGNEVGRLTGHADSVYSVVFSPDGRILVSASVDGTVRVWDPVTQKPIHAPLELFESVYSVAFSPGGDLLAVATNSGVQLWNTSTWGLVARLPTQFQRGPVYRVAFNQDGALLASGSSDRSVVLWDVQSRTRVATLADDRQARVFALAFSPDGNLLVTGADDFALNVWDVKTHQRIGEPLKQHADSVFDIAFSPGGASLASAGADKRIVVWDVEGQNVHPHDQRLSGYAEKYYSLAFSPNGEILASGSSSGQIVWWYINAPRRFGESINHGRDDVYAVDFSPTADVLAAATWAKVALWEGGPQNAPGKARESLGSLKVDPGEWLATVKFSPDGNRIAAGGYDSGDIFLWDVKTRQPVEGSPLKGPAKMVAALAFSPDGKSLAVAGCKNSTNGTCDTADLRVWDLESHASQEFTGAGSALLSVAFNRTGSRLAAAGDDSAVMVWDVPTRKLLWNPDNGHKQRVYALAFSPTDDALMVSASQDSKIMLWDVNAEQRLAVLSLHLLGVKSVAFSPDGKYLASSSLDKTIYVWDVAARQPVYHLPPEQGGAVVSVGFSRDGRRLASAGVRPSTVDPSLSDPLVMWDVIGDSWRSTACSLAARNLTQDEWQLNVGVGNMEPLCPDALLAEALATARRGDRAEAHVLLTQLLAWVERTPDWMNDWELNNAICWDSSIEGFASKVMAACERTIASAPPAYANWLKDTRALALAMVGNVPAALDDWQAFIRWADASNDARAAEQLGDLVPKDLLDRRKAWVAAFKENRNPLDAATLNALRTESAN